MKTCTKCGVEEPVAKFHKKKSGKDGLQSGCTACNAAYRAAARAADPDKFRARDRADKAAAYAADPEKFASRSAANRAVDPEKFRRRQRAWAKRNPAQVNANKAKHKAAKLQATPGWANRSKIKSMFARAAESGMHVDHIVPLQSKLVCGLHVEHNLQVLTGLDNLKKGNRHWPDMP